MLTKIFDFDFNISEYFKKRKRVKARLKMSDHLLRFILSRPSNNEVFNEKAERLRIVVTPSNGSYVVTVEDEFTIHSFVYKSHSEAVAGISNLDAIIIEDNAVGTKFYAEGLKLEIGYDRVNGYGK